MSGVLNFDNPLELPAQLRWKRADESELTGRTIRTRNYNTFVASCMISSLALLGITYA